MSFRTKAQAFTKRASLGDITGFNQSREGWRDLSRTGGPKRTPGLPSNASRTELEERVKDLEAHGKLFNPNAAAVVSGLAGAGYGLAKTRHLEGVLKGGAGGAAGGALGSLLGGIPRDYALLPYLREEIRKRKSSEKKASLAEYSTLFDHIEEGKLGPHVKEALAGVCEAMSSSLQSAQATKQANAPTEADGRQARLNELLRKM